MDWSVSRMTRLDARESFGGEEGRRQGLVVHYDCPRFAPDSSERMSGHELLCRTRVFPSPHFFCSTRFSLDVPWYGSMIDLLDVIVIMYRGSFQARRHTRISAASSIAFPICRCLAPFLRDTQLRIDTLIAGKPGMSRACCAR